MLQNIVWEGAADHMAGVIGSNMQNANVQRLDVADYFSASFGGRMVKQIIAINGLWSPTDSFKVL